jgi:hypothetical protein
MQLLSKSTLLASAIAALVAAPASAAVLTPGTDWTTFFFSGDGSTLEDADTGDTFWTVTLTKAGFLQVTDAFLIGDVFEMSVDGSSIGTTGPFDTTGPETSDPDVAFGGPVYSWLSYALAPGTYEITGIAASSPFGSGGAFLRVVPVPEAATWAMMIAGFGLVGAASRRARQAIA